MTRALALTLALTLSWYLIPPSTYRASGTCRQAAYAPQVAMPDSVWLVARLYPFDSYQFWQHANWTTYRMHVATRDTTRFRWVTDYRGYVAFRYALLSDRVAANNWTACACSTTRLLVPR